MPTSRPPARLAVDGKGYDRAHSRSPSPSRRKKVNKPGKRGDGPLGRGDSGGQARQKSKDNDIFLLPSSDYQILGVLTAIGACVRLFKIYQPSSVVFDEVHFGGFATKYIKGKFFMDVHPPLAKLLITLAGWLAGFDGSFDFKEIGKDYLAPGVPYVAMRMLPALLGILVVPIIFLTLKAAGNSTATASLGAGLVIFENGLVTQSRLILLDSPLVTFTALTALAWTSFLNIHEQGASKAFGTSWWLWLAMTGLGLGATVSVKWVGLFTIAWVGSLTVLQLWFLLGDTRSVPPRLWFKHFLARAFCLIIIPLGFYMLMFAIHLLCLVNPGDGDGFMSSEFQATLNSKGMHSVPADVAFGSRISIRHHNTQGGYLHSHNHMYPTGSKQQQITLYPHKDENNQFLLENETSPDTGIDGYDIITPPNLVFDGSAVKLYHMSTDRRLHSHDVRPPVTEEEWQNEVSAYGYKGFEGDANDLFRVEIVKHLSDGSEAKKRLRTIQTKFKLVHVMTGCVLFSHAVKLPDWGFEQQEVTCAKGATLPNSVWYIENNEHPQLQEGAELVNYKYPGFFSKFWELQKVMWRTNAGLVESHAWDSRPPSWPVLHRGINFWGKDHRQIYLIGNPIIWWSSTVAIAVYLVFKILAVLRWQRGYADYSLTNFRRFDIEVGVAVLGWGFHYFPFYLMERQLFLHHYFPALYFAIIVLCQIFDFITARAGTLGLNRRPAIGWTIATVFLGLSIVTFALYAPLAYGSPWTKAQCNRVKLFEAWDWDCDTFHNSLSEYDNTVATPSEASTPTPVPVVADPHNPQAGEGEAQQPNTTPLAEELKEAHRIPAAGMPERQKVVAQEERIEYRDQDGNILDEEQVKALEGKVEFHTRYETRTRLLDEAGNEVPAESSGVAGPLVDGANPETPKVEPLESRFPPRVDAETESEVDAEKVRAEASPASDGLHET
ncbi:Glycosyltransferase Family 39 protein [Tuber magnatum]|uniref:Dolichyl-phosphate-mannose--protein mannosyltransferase n=1 Tax=Tuber magnatum TaxID=42249 RepID=A0A317SZR9_9PEZI|nr:Glycosyltransferase Family 39 protein [Tuber magnatum]